MKTRSGDARELILRLARENSNWGSLRIAGELRKLGIAISATTERNTLVKAGVAAGAAARLAVVAELPASARRVDPRLRFLHRRHRLAARLYVFAFLSIGRQIEYVTVTSKPDTAWMLQQARNLLMILNDRDRQVRFLIHDRDAKFPRAFDALLENENIKVIRTSVGAPNANAHGERWGGTIRRECLDRLLILGQLEHVLRVYIKYYNPAATPAARPETT